MVCINKSFNPRAREGRDTIQSRGTLKRKSFNPRAREGRDLRREVIHRDCGRFNPRAREGRDRAYWVNHDRYQVSIHAPARGATLGEEGLIEPAEVSIHAPARGATGKNRVNTYLKVVSIHAPARGATSFGYGVGSSVMSFNPRAREGRDLTLPTLISKLSLFQSTRPRGARRFQIICRINYILFQSTRPRGARLRS